jgi:hypothetical protein
MTERQSGWYWVRTRAEYQWTIGRWCDASSDYPWLIYGAGQSRGYVIDIGPRLYEPEPEGAGEPSGAEAMDIAARTLAGHTGTYPIKSFQVEAVARALDAFAARRVAEVRRFGLNTHDGKIDNLRAALTSVVRVVRESGEMYTVAVDYRFTKGIGYEVFERDDGKPLGERNPVVVGVFSTQPEARAETVRLRDRRIDAVYARAFEAFLVPERE